VSKLIEVAHAVVLIVALGFLLSAIAHVVVCAIAIVCCDEVLKYLRREVTKRGSDERDRAL